MQMLLDSFDPDGKPRYADPMKHARVAAGVALVERRKINAPVEKGKGKRKMDDVPHSTLSTQIVGTPAEGTSGASMDPLQTEHVLPPSTDIGGSQVQSTARKLRSRKTMNRSPKGLSKRSRPKTRSSVQDESHESPMKKLKETVGTDQPAREHSAEGEATGQAEKLKESEVEYMLAAQSAGNVSSFIHYMGYLC